MSAAVVRLRNGGGRRDVFGLGLCFSFLVLGVVSADAPIRGQKNTLLKGQYREMVFLRLHLAFSESAPRFFNYLGGLYRVNISTM
jgi:hypothetical protein